MLVALLAFAVRGQLEGPTAARRVVFVKTHKCGSSTLANILYRFGEAHGLRLLLPKDNLRLGWPYAFPGRVLESNPPFDLVAHHAVLDFDKMLTFVPGARFVTIVRNPVSQFLSAWYFFRRKTLEPGWRPGSSQTPDASPTTRFEQRTLTQDAVQSLLNMTHPYNRRQAQTVHRLVNSQSFTLGWSDYRRLHSTSNDTALVDRWLSEVVDRMEVVVVLERMDESLVALAHSLGWPSESLSYRPLNGRRTAYPTPDAGLLDEVRRNFLHVDEKLYRYAHRRLDGQLDAIRTQGGHVEQAVRELQQRNAALAVQCPDSQTSSFCWRHLVPQTLHTALLKALAGQPCDDSGLTRQLDRFGAPDELDDLLQPCRVAKASPRRQPADDRAPRLRRPRPRDHDDTPSQWS